MVAGYEIRSHFESGLGVALSGRMVPGPVTLVRIGGEDLQSLWVAEGMLTESGHDDHLCRTQAKVKVDPKDVADLMQHPLGNHVVLARDPLADLLRLSHELVLGQRGEGR